MSYNVRQIRELADSLGGKKGEELHFLASVKAEKAKAEKEFLEKQETALPELEVTVEDSLRIFDELPDSWVFSDAENTDVLPYIGARDERKNELRKFIRSTCNADYRVPWETSYLELLLLYATLQGIVTVAAVGFGVWGVALIPAVPFALWSAAYAKGSRAGVRSKANAAQLAGEGIVPAWRQGKNDAEWRERLNSPAGVALLEAAGGEWSLAGMALPEWRDAYRVYLEASLRANKEKSAGSECDKQYVAEQEDKMKFIVWAVKNNPPGEPIPTSIEEVNFNE